MHYTRYSHTESSDSNALPQLLDTVLATRDHSETMSDPATEDGPSIPPAKIRKLCPGVCVALLLAGAAGLIFEVVAMRLLRLVMGNTTFAVTTVLAAFMGGLALGSVVGGRVADRRRDLLRLFAAAQAIIAACIVVSPFVVRLGEPLYAFLYRHAAGGGSILGLVRFLYCGLLLLVPCVLMGAALPLLVRHFAGANAAVGRVAGTLYAVNTAGAVVGASAAGFLLLPLLGARGSLWVAAGLSAASAALAYVSHRMHPDAPVASARPTSRRDGIRQAPRGAAHTGRRVLLTVLLAYAVAGVATMAYEVAWTRGLSLVLGSSVYAYSLMLTAFIFGLAVGGGIGSRFADRSADPVRLLAWIEGAVGLSALAVVPLMDRLPLFAMRLVARFQHSFWFLQLAEFGLILLILFVPAMLMGIAFPLAGRIAVRQAGAVGRGLGNLLGANTAGNICGAMFAGFLLIPTIGVQNTVFLAAALNVAAGCMVMSAARGAAWKKGATAAGLLLALALGVALLPRWDPSRLSSGPFIEAIRRPGEELSPESEVANGKLVYQRHGVSCTVSVREYANNERVIFVNGKPDASSSADLPNQLMAAHIPLLLHAQPRSALVIGLASGISVGAAGVYPLKRIDCAEIEPAMVEACRFFEEENRGILDDPRVNIIVEDGRNHLALTDRTYDVIISEPSNPWIAGIGDLFTREFFTLCHEKLNDDGVLCAWLEAYTTDAQGFHSVVKTFQSVFPNMTIWSAQEFDYLLVGFKRDRPLPLHALAQRIATPAIRNDLRRAMVRSVPDFLSNLVTGRDGANVLGRHAALHTDDNALLEFRAPRTMLDPEARWMTRSTVEQVRDADFFFLAAPPDDTQGQAELDEGIRFVEARGHVSRSQLLARRGDAEGAMQALRKASLLNRSDPHLHEVLRVSRLTAAARFVYERRYAAAEEIYRRVLHIDPRQAEAHYGLAFVLTTQDKLVEALDHYTRAIEGAPQSPDYHVALADVAFRLKRHGRAIAHFRCALALRPDWPQAMHNLAWALVADADKDPAGVREAVLLAEQACELTKWRDDKMVDTLRSVYATAGRRQDTIAVTRRTQTAQMPRLQFAEGGTPAGCRCHAWHKRLACVSKDTDGVPQNTGLFLARGVDVSVESQQYHIHKTGEGCDEGGTCVLGGHGDLCRARGRRIRDGGWRRRLPERCGRTDDGCSAASGRLPHQLPAVLQR